MCYLISRWKIFHLKFVDFFLQQVKERVNSGQQHCCSDSERQSSSKKRTQQVIHEHFSTVLKIKPSPEMVQVMGKSVSNGRQVKMEK